MTKRANGWAATGLAMVMACTLPSLPAAAQKSLGSGAGSGPVMTRDELRACLKNRELLNQRTAQLDATRKALDADKAAITAESDALKAERGGIDKASSSVADINARQQKVSAAIEDWNARWKEFEASGRSGPMVERQRQNLLREKQAMEKENAELEALRGGTSSSPEAARKYNERATAAEQRVVAWNQRNAAAVKETEALVQERDLWASECGNRRYREDDEIAIREGK